MRCNTFCHLYSHEVKDVEWLVWINDYDLTNSTVRHGHRQQDARGCTRTPQTGNKMHKKNGKCN